MTTVAFAPNVLDLMQVLIVRQVFFWVIWVRSVLLVLATYLLLCDMQVDLELYVHCVACVCVDVIAVYELEHNRFVTIVEHRKKLHLSYLLKRCDHPMLHGINEELSVT